MLKINVIEKLPEDGQFIENSENLENNSEYLRSASSIILNFPSFTDGRAYSQARRLRRDGFKGQLIASGDIRADQARQYARVGFSALYFSTSYDREVIENDLTRFPAAYQNSAEETDAIYNRRAHNKAEATISGGGPF